MEAAGQAEAAPGKRAMLIFTNKMNEAAGKVYCNTFIIVYKTQMERMTKSSPTSSPSSASAQVSCQSQTGSTYELMYFSYPDLSLQTNSVGANLPTNSIKVIVRQHFMAKGGMFSESDRLFIPYGPARSGVCLELMS